MGYDQLKHVAEEIDLAFQEKEAVGLIASYGGMYINYDDWKLDIYFAPRIALDHILVNFTLVRKHDTDNSRQQKL